MVLEPNNPFWRFSLKVYAAPGVTETCLAAQDSFAVNVNVLLFAAWLGAERGIALEERNIDEIFAAVQPWHETVVRPLRLIRLSLKSRAEMIHSDVKALRNGIAANELQAEQIEQALLFSWAEQLRPQDASSSNEDLVRANIAMLLERYSHGASKQSVDGLVAASINAVA
jgi:uncharacterized protein (TIGR02444 family)